MITTDTTFLKVSHTVMFFFSIWIYLFREKNHLKCNLHVYLKFSNKILLWREKLIRYKIKPSPEFVKFILFLREYGLHFSPVIYSINICWVSRQRCHQGLFVYWKYFHTNCYFTKFIVIFANYFYHYLLFIQAYLFQIFWSLLTR